VSQRSSLRLLVLAVLVFSLLATLVARAFFLQVVEGPALQALAHRNTAREIVTPAVRGLILDQVGRPLVSNRTSTIVTIDRQVLAKQPQRGAILLKKLADLLGVPVAEIGDRLLTCGAKGAKPPPVCWNGSTYQPVPVMSDIDSQTALSIMERRSDFPGVTAQLQAIRQYPAPFNVNAAHMLGYLGPVTEAQVTDQANPTAPERLRRTDVVGRSGLEKAYDQQMRGTPGVTQLAVDTAGHVVGTAAVTQPQAGDTIVTNLDAKLQKVVEDQLLAAVARAQQQGYPGSAGAAVVIDVRNGHVLSMASYPTYDPAIWVGGVTAKQYQQLQESDSLSSNAYQGLFAPGSTFKVISTTAAGKDGFNLYGSYDCPASLKIGTQTFRNFESSGYGSISLSRAIEVSCNTVFYEIADRMWQQAGGITATKESADPIAEAARMYGLGSPTGIDLPGEAGGRISSRLFKSANWNAMKDTWCANAKAGYPQTRQQNPALAEFYTAIDAENCKDGYQWRVGDALNAAIGQGDTVVTPLQMAMVYAAVANGGTVYQPQIAKALVSPEGKVVKTFDPVVKSTINVPKSTMNFLHATLPGVTSNGTAETPFAGFPLGQIPVAAKTGSAQVTGNKPSTSWFASYAPADNPKYAIVMMIAQGGTGSKTSGPSVRKIYEALFGISGKNVDPASSVLMGGRPRDALPVFRPDGTPVGPSGKESGVVAQRNDPTSSSSNGSG